MVHEIVDIHTHVYPSTYISLLRSRTTVPYIYDPPGPAPPRLIILPSDDDHALPHEQRGRPIGPEYSSVAHKLAFMDQHQISTSVISLANPWLDFLDPAEASQIACEINDELESICAANPGRLYAFATLPLSAPTPVIVEEILRLKRSHHVRGIILGTTGLGSGLDDPSLDTVWSALEESKTLVFLHPHYGLPVEVYGPRAHEYGHVLPLSLGFPMETTISFTRMWLSGVFDRYLHLRVLIAHAGGTIPFLAGRVESCVTHERRFRDEQGKQQARRSIWDVLTGNVWLDAVTYSEVGLKSAVEAVGTGRVLFGTDHPFFPPMDDGYEEWLSVRTNVEAITLGLAGTDGATEKVLGSNAVRLLGLEGSRIS